MLRKFLIGTVVFAALSASAFSQAKFGTAAEAKAMLEKAVAAVKADKAKAIDMFIKGEGGFLDRDIYPFCVNNSDGKILATQSKTLIGTDARTLKDKAGKAFGQELYDAGQKTEGTISEVSYMFPRPGETEPAQKVSFVTKVGDIYCGVGYYK
jgi:hypothetical protein